MKTIFLLTIAFFALNPFEKTQTDYLGAYEVVYNTQMKAPIYSKHKLFKGGGDCSRKGMDFKPTKYSATHKDYAHNGYDIGHLVSAEDFAYSCELEHATFNFENAMPQTPNLNRGIWKVDETYLRKLSQHDSILQFSGGIYLPNHKTIGDGVSVPDSCFKYAINLNTHKVVRCRVYTNKEKENFFHEATKEQIERQIYIKLE